ncbi:hypothetical protein RND71_030737 [Anisodus tanguticus]|uniref:ENTH domain-containing protein n=1 Tax=Anisodus tanguticus TaxID=243964 RepID=A0AAE1RHR0_9SOLA|nr:hypothetical protein RND71_030737 [Anisodus tanguticus]
MARTTIRKATGAVKDQTSIGIAKVASNMAPELEVAIFKAASHDDEPAGEKYIREILQLTSYSRGYVSPCMSAISKRLGITRDWMVALKCLMLIHRLLNDGDAVFQQEIMKKNGGEIGKYGSREEQWRSSQSSNYDHGEFRDEPGYGMRKSRSSGDVRESIQEKKDVTPLREMKPERIFGEMTHLQRLLDQFLSCWPRTVLVALYPMVRESFKMYTDICDVLAVLLDKFFDMEYEDCVKAFDVYASAVKQIDELVGFFNWCKDIGVARSSEYPEVSRITSKLLDILEEFVRDRAKAMKSPERKVESQPAPQEEEPTPDMNEIRALPPPEDYTSPPPPEPEPPKPAVQETGDLNPAAESGKADWELALVEIASNLSKQKAALGGGLDPLLLNGMYDQSVIRQHVATAQSSGGSASIQIVVQDPFAASLTVPPPSYVQMADLQKKEQLLVQEQMVCQQYTRDGMQGQTSLAKITTGGYYGPGQPPVMPYGMPPVNGAPAARYYYTPY